MSAVYELGYNISESVDLTDLDAREALDLWRNAIDAPLNTAREIFRGQEITNGYTTYPQWQAILNKAQRTLTIRRQYTELQHAQARQTWVEQNFPPILGVLTQSVSRSIDNDSVGEQYITID